MGAKMMACPAFLYPKNDGMLTWFPCVWCHSIHSVPAIIMSRPPSAASTGVYCMGGCVCKRVSVCLSVYTWMDVSMSYPDNVNNDILFLFMSCYSWFHSSFSTTHTD
jgi:hypothetical protein